jgi:hypothetical protein
MRQLIGYAILALLAVMACTNQSAASPPDDCVAVTAPAKLLDILKTWDTEILFFTSSSNPLRNLDEINDSGKQIGINGISLFRNAKVFGKFGGINPDANVDEEGNSTGDGSSGNYYLNPDPFSKNPTLKLYIGWPGKDEWFVKEMRDNGGACVRFKGKSSHIK